MLVGVGAGVGVHQLAGLEATHREPPAAAAIRLLLQQRRRSVSHQRSRMGRDRGTQSAGDFGGS